MFFLHLLLIKNEVQDLHTFTYERRCQYIRGTILEAETKIKKLLYKKILTKQETLYSSCLLSSLTQFKYYCPSN